MPHPLTPMAISRSTTFRRVAIDSLRLIRDSWNNTTSPELRARDLVFSLRLGEKVNDVLFRLIAADVITGRVSNEDGDPMQRVEVTALRRPSEEEIEDDDAPRRHKIEMQSVGKDDLIAAGECS